MAVSSSGASSGGGGWGSSPHGNPSGTQGPSADAHGGFGGGLSGGNPGEGGGGSGGVIGTPADQSRQSSGGDFNKAADLGREKLGLPDPAAPNKSLASKFGNAVKGFFGSVAGTVAGTALGGPVGGVVGGILGSSLTDAFSDKGPNEKAGSMFGRVGGSLLGGTVGSGLGVIGTGAVKAGGFLGSEIGERMGAKTDAAQPTGIHGLAQEGLANMKSDTSSPAKGLSDAPLGGQGGGRTIEPAPVVQAPDSGIGMTASMDHGYVPEPTPDPSIAANEHAEAVRASFKDSYNSLQNKFNQQMAQALGGQTSYL